MICTYPRTTSKLTVIFLFLCGPEPDYGPWSVVTELLVFNCQPLVVVIIDVVVINHRRHHVFIRYKCPSV